MGKFIGREQELTLLKNILQKKSASVIIYGKRKVGKTTLIKHALEYSSDITVYYECLKASQKENIDGFVTELVRSGVLPVKLSFNSFADIFAYLKTLNRQLNIVIDEYPYLKEFESAQNTDSQFQSIIDNSLDNIRLFISGSHIGMMKDMLNEKNALYGRFSLTIQLKELNYLETADFYKQKTVYDKIAFYSVFGGSPFINGFINPDEDLKTNIINTLLNQTSPVYNYAEHLFISDFSTSINAHRIMYAIANGKKKYREIETMLDMKDNGLLSKQLISLLDMEIVTKTFPINRPDDKKKTSYELCDNLMRFYYAFIYKNKSALTMLGGEVFYEEYIEKPIITFISHRFEEICRCYFSLRAKSGEMHGISNIGMYYYDDSVTHTSGEFDVVLKRQEAYDIYEAKFYTSPLSLKEMEKEAEKIREIKGVKVGKIGFISVSGYEEANETYDLIDGKMLYRE